jgi:phycocyanobilin lyase subunit beta
MNHPIMTDPDSLKLLLDAIAQADSSARMVTAVEQLAEARLVAAVPNLIAVLGYNNPGAAVAAVAGLIAIGKPAVKPLLELLDGYNYGARAWGLRALAGIGDPQGLDLLLDAAQNDFALSVRRAAARGLGTINWDELPEEAIEPAQIRSIEALIIISQDHEWVVRYAAITGLQALAIACITHNSVSGASLKENLTRQILAHFDRLVDSDDNLAVIARIWLAQKEIQTHINAILNEQPSLEPTVSIDWQTTLAKLYARKRQEQPHPEGDPYKFRQVAAAIFRDK